MKIKRDKLKTLWFVFGILSVITVIALTHNMIGLVLTFHGLGMSLQHAINVFILHGIFAYIATLIIGVSAFLKWKPALLLNVMMSYLYFQFFYGVFLSRSIIEAPWVLSRNISAVSGVLMSLCGLILLFIYLFRFFKTKK